MQKHISIEFFKQCGKRGGKKKSERKTLAARANIAKRWANHKKSLPVSP